MAEKLRVARAGETVLVDAGAGIDLSDEIAQPPFGEALAPPELVDLAVIVRRRVVDGPERAEVVAQFGELAAVISARLGLESEAGEILAVFRPDDLPRARRNA